MARSWLVDSKIIARKVKNATLSSSRQSRETGTGVYRECPKCKHRIDNSDVAVEWPGLPAGVKFDPSDLELIEHLAGKVELKNSKLHPLIDEFIPTLEEDEGICYTHPENLPGVKLDGSSIHFFHRTSKAYSTGCRKRRRIQRGDSLSEDHVRWHKTGKTRPVIENGIQKGCKKIMVLYKSSKKSKPDKTNWVMHQYHLGTEEDEKEGELVVSKVFYQQQSFQVERNDVKETETSERLNFEDLDLLANKVDPRTPKTQTPDPLRPHIIDPYDEGDEDIEKLLCDQGTCLQLTQVRYSSTSVNEVVVTPWLAGESQVVEDPDPLDLDSSLLCHEVFDSFNIAQDKGLEQFQPYAHSDHTRNNTHGKDFNSFPGIPDLDSIYVDTPPDFNLSDLQFGSQESILDWIDWL